MTDKELWEKSQLWNSSDDGRGGLKLLESVEKFAALIRADKPVLQNIEQYRMQMAGICTAAIGYWKESDGIHPDYDTLALRDVAKLYAKYDELYKAQPVPHAVIAGALFDFMGWLTSRKERLVLSGADEASPAVDAIRDFAKMRGLSLDDAKVQGWQDNASPPAAQPERQPLTDKQILADETLRYYFGQNGGAGPVSKQGRKVVNAIEALHGIKEVKSCGS